MLEELKAQTGGIYYVEFLRKKGIISDEQAKQTYVDGIVWAFGHISRGMYASDGTPRNYSQLAAIQVGSFLQSGGLSWNAASAAANGSDKGCLEIDFARLPAAVEALERNVLQIKARGDKAGAERLKAQFVDAQDSFAAVKASITERWLRAPKATFVYSLLF